MAKIVKCALLQVGQRVPMTEPIETIRAAMNEKCAGMIAAAARQGAHIIALPELFTMPYFARFTDARWYAAAEPIPTGPTVSLMRDLARRYAVVIIAPIYELDGQARYNSAAVVDADGKYLGVYRKHHVPTYHTGNYEPFYFHQPNLGFPIFETAYGKIGVYICYDRHFPEVARIYGVKGAEIVFNPSATGGKNSERVWELEQQAYALNNGYFLAALNRVGQGEPYDVGRFFGKSYFCSPLGEIIAQGGKGTEEIVLADLDLDELSRARETWHTQRLYIDRRPGTYTDLVKDESSAYSHNSGEEMMTTPTRKQLRYKPIMTQEMKDAAIRALEDGRMIRGNFEKDSEGGRFEDDFCRYIDAKHGVAVSSGFAALHVALMAAGIGPGDEVITEARSFISVGDVIVLVGATPVFVDIDPLTLNIDPGLIEAAITPRTKAIMPVHNNGLTCEMDPIREIARRHGLKLIVDSCQSIGTCYKNSRAATLGDINAFSFVRNKSMTVGGEGGMVITDDDELAYRSQLLSNHGRGSDYRETHNSQAIGFNYRLSEILAAVGRVQLRHVDDWNHQRRTNTAIYQELFAQRKLPITYTIEPTWGYHTRMRSVILVPQRDELVRYLSDLGIQASPEYKVPIHLNTPYVEKYGFHKGQLPVSERVANETLVLPGWPGLTRADIEYVVDAVDQFYNKR